MNQNNKENARSQRREITAN